MSKEKPILCKALDNYDSDKLIDGLIKKTEILCKNLKGKPELCDREEIAHILAEMEILLDMFAIKYNVSELIGYWRLIALSQIAKEIGYGKH